MFGFYGGHSPNPKTGFSAACSETKVKQLFVIICVFNIGRNMYCYTGLLALLQIKHVRGTQVAHFQNTCLWVQISTFAS